MDQQHSLRKRLLVPLGLTKGAISAPSADSAIIARWSRVVKSLSQFIVSPGADPSSGKADGSGRPARIFIGGWLSGCFGGVAVDGYEDTVGSASQVDWAGYMELRGVDNSCGAVRTAGTGLLHAVSLHIWLLMAALLPVLRWKYRLNLCASALRVLVPVRGAVPHVCSRNQDRMFRLWLIDGVTKA